MYRPSNDRNNQYPPMGIPNNIPNNPYNNMQPKMHPQSYSNSIPIYYQSIPYDYGPPQTINNQQFDRNYPPWRDISQQKNNQNIPITTQPPIHYDVRPMQYPPNLMDKSYPPQVPTTPQVNVIQRLSGIIKSQVSQLQAIMLYVDRKTQQQRLKKQRDRSRSRERHSKRSPRQKQHKQWACARCSFLNFDFRDVCKRCNQPKNSGQSKSKQSQAAQNIGGKNYQPMPDDWRCSKCGNINYARRTQCHRCHTNRSK